jgi:hypothetical protein
LAKAGTLRPAQSKTWDWFDAHKSEDCYLMYARHRGREDRGGLSPLLSSRSIPDAEPIVEDRFEIRLNGGSGNVFGRPARLLSLALILLSGTATADTPLRLGAVIALAYSNDGTLLAAGDQARKLALFHADDGSLAAGFAPRELGDRILALRFSPDGRQLEVATSSALQQFDVASGVASKALPLTAAAAVLSADAKLLAFAEGDDVSILNVVTGKHEGTFATGLGFPETLAFSPNGDMLAVGAQETILTLGAPSPHGVPSGDLEVFDLPSGHRRIFKALSPWFSAIGFSADSSRLAAITFDRPAGGPINGYKNTAINVWDAKSGDPTLQAALPDNTSLYSYLVFLGTSLTIVSTSGASWGGDIAIIDTTTGKITHAGSFDIPAIFSAALAPSGKFVAAGLLNGVQLREIPSRRLAQMLGIPAPTAQKP